jgi:hypothetical protein
LVSLEYSWIKSRYVMYRSAFHLVISNMHNINFDSWCFNYLQLFGDKFHIWSFPLLSQNHTREYEIFYLFLLIFSRSRTLSAKFPIKNKSFSWYIRSTSYRSISSCTFVELRDALSYLNVSLDDFTDCSVSYIYWLKECNHDVS